MSSSERYKVTEKQSGQTVTSPKSTPITVVDVQKNDTSENADCHPHALPSILELSPLPTPGVDNLPASQSTILTPVVARGNGHWLRGKISNSIPMTIPIRAKQGSSSTSQQSNVSMTTIVEHELRAAQPDTNAPRTSLKRSFEVSLSDSNLISNYDGLNQPPGRKKKKPRHKKSQSAKKSSVEMDAMHLDTEVKNQAKRQGNRATKLAKNSGKEMNLIQLDTEVQSQAKRRRTRGPTHTSQQQDEMKQTEKSTETPETAESTKEKELREIIRTLISNMTRCSGKIKRIISSKNCGKAIFAEIESEAAMDAKSLWDAMLAITENLGEVRENGSVKDTLELFVARNAKVQLNRENEDSTSARAHLPSAEGEGEREKTIGEEVLSALEKWDRKEEAKYMIRKQIMYQLLTNRIRDCLDEL